MSKLSPVLAFFLIILFNSCNHTQHKSTSFNYVDPFVGTGAHGHTFPGATLPFGMVQLSPDTRNDNSWDGCGGYHYSDSSIIGFSHTHLSGVGVSDYGDILFLPFTGKNVSLNSGISENPDDGYRSRFSHENEKATPGYYSVKLDDYNVEVELTSTASVGIHRYTYLNAKDANVLIDLTHRDPVMESTIRVVNEYEIEGFRRSKFWAGNQVIYFVARFSSPIVKSEIFSDNDLLDDIIVSGKNIKATFNFGEIRNNVLEAKVAISAVSTEGARNNLDSEAGNLSFDDARKNAKNIWIKNLSKIEVEGGSEKQKRIFYTSLYHSLLTPNRFMDVDGKYRGMDGEIHQAKDFTNYTVFSLWDTFRALHPLLTITHPEESNDFVKTLIKKYEQFGELPMWELAANDTRCMIGYHGVSVIADAYAKGIRNYNVESAFAAIKNSANVNKRGINLYRQLGYVPSNKSSQSVSKTLEYAYNDWCIAKMAKALNKDTEYETFIARSQYYRNIYDPSTGFMRGKADDRTWIDEHFDPMRIGFDYTEGNSFQYSLFVPHDTNGLIELIGGNSTFNNWLDKLFTTELTEMPEDDSDVSGLIGNYAHGNEPSHHLAYLYNYSGKAWKGQGLTRQIMSEMYADTPSGICGNEDCGQMSA